jgi:hypothetical protein
MPLISLTNVAFAQDGLLPCTGLDCDICDLGAVFNKLIIYAIEFASIAAIVITFWGGFKMLMSAGNEEAVKTGKRMIWGAAVGLAIVLSAWIVVDSIFKILAGGNSRLGPWNQLQCPEFLQGEVKLSDTGKAPTLQAPARQPATNPRGAQVGAGELLY